jgi:DNA-binding NtrC family response regulator
MRWVATISHPNLEEVSMTGNRLLFVDDEPAIRMTLPLILQQEGFEVTAAATVAETLEYISKEPFDVLLADLNIGQPGDGFTVISAMRRTQPQAITLILTGFPDFDTALQALRSQVKLTAAHNGCLPVMADAKVLAICASLPRCCTWI